MIMDLVKISEQKYRRYFLHRLQNNYEWQSILDMEMIKDTITVLRQFKTVFKLVELQLKITHENGRELEVD